MVLLVGCGLDQSADTGVRLSDQRRLAKVLRLALRGALLSGLRAVSGEARLAGFASLGGLGGSHATQYNRYGPVVKGASEIFMYGLIRAGYPLSRFPPCTQRIRPVRNNFSTRAFT